MTQVRLIALLLATIFAVEAVIMFVLPVMVSTHASRLVAAGVDAFLLVVLLAPALWWMIIHPLQSGVVSEQQRAIAIMRSAFHGIITIDEAGSIESVNPEVERIFGYREEELLGKPVTLLMPERYRERHRAGLDHRARSIASSTHHVRRVIDAEGLRKDGSEFQLEVSMVAWQTAAGARKYAGFTRDITALKRTEQRYQAVVENIDEIVYVVETTGDPFAGRVVFVSNNAQRTTGYTPQELMDNPQLWSSLIHPDDLSSVASLTRQMFREHTPVTRQYRIRHKQTDNYRWVDDRVVPRFEQGGPQVTLFGVARDITERRAANESRRLQSAALHAAADGIVITDRAGVIEWVNPAFTQITGYPADEALGKHHRDLVRSGTHTRAFFKDLWETILAGRTWRGEVVNRRKDGSRYTEQEVVTPVLDGSGAITHFVAIQQDITARLQLEAQFRQAQKMECVGQLASGIAHDFNNLLTVINGMSGLVLEQVGKDDPMHADVQEILHAGQRAATLTHQLLAFSRRQILEPRVLSLNTVVAGMESLLRRLLGEDINLVVRLTPDLGRVKVDRGQIEQVITNLAVNARGAMPQGGQLTVETENVTIGEDYARPPDLAIPPGSYVLLAVSDSGVGMDEATRVRIFEPFFTTKASGQGTGLGLSTVHGIVAQSQGFIWVDSEVSRGTNFKICLPQVTEAVAADGPEPTAVSSTGTETILLVEDDAELRKLATRLLEPAGYTVLGAATGEEALRLLERHEKPVQLLVSPVHLLLSDVVLPDMNGRRLAEQIAQTHPRMKVLYMSGYTSDTVVRHGVLEMQVHFLHKPFTSAALLRKVREVLDS
jgi:PAS domain S-box-containing protein